MNPAFDLSVILPIFRQAVTYDVIDSGGGEHTEPIKNEKEEIAFSKEWVTFL